MQVEQIYLGTVAYQQGLELMKRKIADAVKNKTTYLLGLEHPLVYTAGVKTKAKDILDHTIETVPVRRGGSVNVHNEGQLVVYTIIPLEHVPGGLDRCVRFIESTLMESCLLAGVETFTWSPNSGVYTTKGKVGFIGLGLNQNVTYHGCAINLTNDLAPYQKVKNCGLPIPMTRLCEDSSFEAKFKELPYFFKTFCRLFQERFQPISPVQFRDKISDMLYRLKSPLLSLRIGLIYYNESRYWAAHEAWEMVWHYYKPSPFKTFLQGLIQLAMGMYKITEKPNLQGAKSLLSKAQQKLASNEYVQTYLTEPENFLIALSDKISSIKNALENDNKPAKTFMAQIPIAIKFDLEVMYNLSTKTANGA